MEYHLLMPLKNCLDDIVEESREKVDRISMLPEALLHRIMSLLSFKQIVRTCVLSKTWEGAWNTFPILEFDRTFFKKVSRDNMNYYDNFYDIEGDMRREVTFLRLLDHVKKILRHPLQQMIARRKLSTLDIISRIGENCSSKLEHCFSYTIKSNVKEMKINLTYYAEPYNFLQRVLCSESMDVLMLRGYQLESPRRVRLSSLRKLKLERVIAATKVIENIVAGCPVIEDLSIHNCEGFNSLELFDVSKLSRFNLQCNEELECLEIRASNCHLVFIRGSFRLREINVVNCKNLKSLSLLMVSIRGERLCNQISKLTLLEFLDLRSCNQLKSINISSSCLKRLNISTCEGLFDVKLATPNLSVFNYTGGLISFSSSGGSTQVETDVHFISENIDTRWYIEYIELLAKFHSFSRVLNLQCRRDEDVILPEDLRQTILPPFCGVKHFSFLIVIPLLPITIKNVVDGLLWISPHAKTLSIESDDVFKKSYFQFQFSYKELIHEEGIPECCKSLPVACWHQCIEEVKIEYSWKEQVERYIFKGEDIWEKMDCLRSYRDVRMLH